MNTQPTPLLSIEQLEHCEATIVVTDLDGRIVAASLGAAKAFNTQRAALIGRHADELARGAASWSLPDGRVVRVLHDARPDMPADVSKAALDRLQSIASAVPALLCYIDRDCRYAWANEIYRRWFKLSPDEVRGRHVREVLGENGWEAVRGHMERVFEGHEVTFSQHFEYPTGPRHIRATYSPHIAPDGQVLGLVGMINDISEIKAAERALRRSEYLLGHSQEVAHVGSWEMAVNDDEVGAVSVWWSDELYRIFGYEPESVFVTDGVFFQALHPDDRAKVRAASIAGRASGEPYENRCRIIRPDGSVRTIHAYIEFERDETTKRLRMLGTCQDITERYAAEDALHEADRRKDEFLAMLAHELRNPLAPILTAAELLEFTGEAVQPKAPLARVIRRQVQHMKRLLDDLLDVSRVSRGKIELRKEPVELGALLRQTMEACQRTLEDKRHTLTLELTPQALVLDADPTRVVQVFSNLMTNAAKYTDAGGNISLTSSAESGHAIVTVRDDGIGMLPELLGRAFDLFVQDTRSLDRAQGGLGIGLTLVRTLVELHGGTVTASSDGPSLGSQFVVRLPLARDLTWTVLPEPGHGALASTEPRRRALRVLVVDDNVDAANGLGALLNELGHQVTIAYEGRSALAAAVELDPELAFLDIGLPGMDGYSVAKKLRELGCGHTTLVAVSGYGQDEFQRRSRASGFDRYVVKPVDLSVLHEIIAASASKAETPAIDRRARVSRLPASL